MPKNSILKRVITIIGIAALAISAGAAAAGLTMNSFVDSLSVPSVGVSVQNRLVTATGSAKAGDAARSSLAIYKKRTAAGSGLDKALLPSDQVGAGLIITSDGWIAFPASLLSGRDPLVAVFADRTFVPLDLSKAVRDDATGLAYLKTGGQRLAVASFGGAGGARVSDPVFIAGLSEVTPTSIVALRRLAVSAKLDYVESSERLARRIAIDKQGIAGAPLVDMNGAVVGICMGDATAVPAPFVTDILRGLFRDGKITRPSAGLRFVSLDGLPSATEAGLPESGALVTGGGKFLAVAKGSAAEAAHLAEGDVIVAIEHDRINDEVTLAERLQDYPPGEQVEITLLRGGRQMKAAVTLK